MSALVPFLSESRDPTENVWSPTLPLELALKTASPAELQREYGYSDEAWAALPKNPIFMQDLAAACELVRQEGMSFKLRAKMLAEDNLKTVYKMIHSSNDAVPAAVKSKLIELTAQWAGYDVKTQAAAALGTGGGGTTLAIQINLGTDY